MARFTTDKPPRSVADRREGGYLHCAKVIKRAGLWTPAAQVDRATFDGRRLYRDQLKRLVEAITPPV
jgi:hypothetical protein